MFGVGLSKKDFKSVYCTEYKRIWSIENVHGTILCTIHTLIKMITNKLPEIEILCTCYTIESNLVHHFFPRKLDIYLIL